MDTYVISWDLYHPANGAIDYGRRTFKADVQFHSAVAAVFLEMGPVELPSIEEEMVLASKAGAHVDPMQLIFVLAKAIGNFAMTGECAKAPTPLPRISAN